MMQHSKHTWLNWDDDLVNKQDEKQGNVVFQFAEDESTEDFDFNRGYILISNDREIYLEDERVFAADFEHEGLVDVAETGIYDENGRLLINVQKH
jgi:hypothetical protein